MRIWEQFRLQRKLPVATSSLTMVLVIFILVLSSPPANALPAFARKYGLRCSACHEAWPMLNYFGQKFKDNGYQLMNDRDAPIWQNPSYWPVTFRIIPLWHRESNNKVAVDTEAQSPGGPIPAERRISSSGFDLSGLDFHTGGTLEKNISFYVLPSSDATASFHFETVMGRLDNLFGSPWLNVKLGKFELDNLVSEKRILTLTAISGVYQTYHFRPQGDGNIFGQIGDNQLGVELMGHSANDRTRYSAALLSSSDGQVNLPYGSNAYSGFFTASQAFNVGKWGVDRVGAYAMIGVAPTSYLTLTTGGTATPIAGSGTGNRPYNREGFVGLFYFGKLDFQVVTQHGWDSAWFGAGYGDFIGGNAPNNNTPGSVLPPGFRAPSWNGYLVETHYVYSPQLIFIQRSEWERMSQQADPTVRSDLGNVDMYTLGYRYMPIMTSRAGFAWHNEYSWMRQRGISPVNSRDVSSSSLLLGFDFDF
ncbi:MAG: hypothetical protein JOY93_04420 [Acidobacteriales bacterium]|nr:hypothetical protein [Terriglobales bacterium]